MKHNVPDWADSPHAVLDEDEILEELNIRKEMIPYLKAVVAHIDYSKNSNSPVNKDEIIRIESRIGNKYPSSGWGILEEYEDIVDELENHPKFIKKSHHFHGDPTYVSFYFEVPEAFEEIYEYFR